MQNPSVSPSDFRDTTDHAGYDPESCQSSVMWPAIIGGALAIVVVAFMLFSLIAALDFASLSPWAMTPAMGKTFAISGAIALIIIQWISAAFGGYMTGRLRTKYVGAHTHEVFFRDTVHGFLAWALATFVGALLFASAAAHMHRVDAYGDGYHPSSHTGHYVSRLFVGTSRDVSPSDQDRADAERILDAGVINGSIPQDDKTYLTQLVSSRAGLSEADAERRVEDVLVQEKKATESARKYAATASLFIFFAMMIGAFIASAAGGLGGQHRDLHYTTGKLTE